MTEHEETKLEAVHVWGSEPPVFSIGYEREKIAPSDSGFTVLFSDAPDPSEVDNPLEHPEVNFMDMEYLLEEHPEIARGLDIAHEYGLADLADSGEWVVGDLSRLGGH